MQHPFVNPSWPTGPCQWRQVLVRYSPILRRLDGSLVALLDESSPHAAKEKKAKRHRGSTTTAWSKDASWGIFNEQPLHFPILCIWIAREDSANGHMDECLYNSKLHIQRHQDTLHWLHVRRRSVVTYLYVMYVHVVVDLHVRF